MPKVYAIILALLLAGCQNTPTQPSVKQTAHDGAPPKPVSVAHVKEPVPKTEPYSRYGNPDSYVALGKRYQVWDSHLGYQEEGVASWYGTKFHGRRTSSGEEYDMFAMTAAHKNLPIPSYVRVTNLDNNKSTVVRVNDRGPFAHGRIIDLSYAAANKLDILNMGTARVKVEAIDAKTHGRPLPAQPAAEPIFVQVAAFTNPANAENLLTTLQSHTDKPVQIKSDTSLYRVHVGPFISESEVNTFKSLMASLNLGSSLKVLH